ncbi:MAG TPA: ABC transporter substrate-binding protein [Rhodocyclaceae bacterium]|nr:ABC transporter substrate-binding protein [Rhodocyclaceae bacterium]
MSLNNDIRSTSPGVNRDANTDSVMMHVVEGLVAYREDGTPAPMLAHDIRLSDEGRAYTFTLREGVRFHNGAVLTSADVVWTWRRYLDPATGWTCLSDFDGSRGARIVSVDAIDAHTVVFRLDRASPMLLTQMAALPCGASGILHPDSLNADGSWHHPVATGPWRLGEWKRGQYVDLIAFPDYVPAKGDMDGYAGGKIAHFRKLRWLVIRDDASRRAALIKGQIDVMPEVSLTDIEQLRKFGNLTIESAPAMATSALLIQSEDPLLSDPKLRLAIARSLDMDIITRLATGGTGAANASLVPTMSPYYSPIQRRGYGRDLAVSKRLLAESRYSGERLVMLTNRRYPEMYAQALMIQSMAREAGIDIELQVLEWATQLDRYQNGNYQLMSFAYTTRVDPYMGYDSMLGDREQNRRKTWDNPEAIALLAQAGTSSDPAERQRLFDRLHAMMLVDVPLVMLYNLADVNAVNRSVEGIRPWPISRLRLWNVRRRTQEK